MENVVSTFHQLVEDISIRDATLDNLNSVVCTGIAQVRARAAHEIIKHDDLAHRLFRQLIYQMRTDKARSTNDKHATIPKHPSSILLNLFCLTTTRPHRTWVEAAWLRPSAIGHPYG